MQSRPLEQNSPIPTLKKNTVKYLRISPPIVRKLTQCKKSFHHITFILFLKG